MRPGDLVAWSGSSYLVSKEALGLGLVVSMQDGYFSVTVLWSGNGEGPVMNTHPAHKLVPADPEAYCARR